MYISDKKSNIQIVKSTLSNIVSSLSGNMLSYGLGLMLLSQTSSAISFGIELIITPVISFLFLIPIGNLVDNHKHKPILVFSSIARIFFLGLLIISIDHFNGLYKLIPVIPFVAVNSICTNISTTTYSSSVHELVNSEKIQQLSSLTNAANSFASIFSPILGVGLYSLLGFDGFILIEIVSAIVAFLIMLSMKFYYSRQQRSQEPVDNQPSQLKEFKAGLSYISQRKLIANIIFIGVFLNFIFSSMNIGLPYIIKTELHIGTQPIGYLDTANAIGLLAGSLFTNFLPEGKGLFKKISWSLLSIGLSILSLGLVFNISKVYLILVVGGSLFLFIIGFALSIIEVTTQVRLQKTIPTNMLGRVMSTLTTANTALFPIGSLFYTFLFDTIARGSYIFIGNGIFCTMFGFLIILKLSNAIKEDDLFLSRKHNLSKSSEKN
ncbi:MFS transporter [Ligilactobacillus acidipiscis]|uniref:Permease, major facilitator superfamily n=3 Tax=Ligilactobacillus acidipiscis TaxID=89059 RepID=A0A0R2K5B2_9LACO|nr:MFS transporter [Ligilactobacillus acidipiscis]KRN81607.1 permease, major facilitator superfamily [Ligilactobacillus acidipiscis]